VKEVKEKTMSSQPPEAESPATAAPEAPAAPPRLPAAPAPMPIAAPYVQLPKSPGLAAFLSLFPGLGQVYNGQIARAFVFFFGFVGSIYLAASGHEFPFAFLIPFVYLFNMIDAWKGATAINQRFLGGESQQDAIEDAVESPLWGASLVAIGLLVLMSNMGWLDLDRLAQWWPLLLIAVGGYFLYGSIQSKKAERATDEPPSL
jgi:TM2 domain-containing membrane protein YozV